MRILPGQQDLRMSAGAELQLMVAKLKVPVRFYWAWNPLVLTGYLPHPPLLIDRSAFPNAASFQRALNTVAALTPVNESRSRFRFSVGRTF